MLLCCKLAHSEVTVSKNGKVKKMLFVITIWVLCIRKEGLRSFNMIEGGYLKNMGAISGGLKIMWDKKQFGDLGSLL